MDRINELLDRIQDLSDDELQELRDLVLAEIQTKSKPDPEKKVGELELTELEVLASAATKIKSERARRDQFIVDEHNARRAMAQFREEETRFVVPADRDPRRSALRGRSQALTASGGAITDRIELVDHATDAINRYRSGTGPRGADGDKTVIASLHSGREEANLGSPEAGLRAVEVTAAAHEHKLRGLLAAAASGQPEAITAAGGLGAPEDTDYSLIGFESADRPAKSALPTLPTSRGGIRFMRSPTLSATEGAHAVWTVEDDIEAATNAAVRKPSLRITPGPEIVMNVQAITNIITVGNLITRAYPELVSRWLELSTATHARLAETQLVTQIGSLCTGVTGQSQGDRGTTRILLPLLERAAVGMRYRQRMKPDFPMQLFLPHWAKAVLRTDLALQEPGDATLGVTDAELTQYLAFRNIAPTWLMEGEAGQGFNPQAPGNVVDWPTRILCYLFPAGAFSLMDGGTLDLGMIRDSTLNAANDYQMFMETFEAAVYRGGEAFRISVPVNPSGIARAA